ncbi:transposase [Pseudotabrizicola sp. 4114]|uniref:transposase n=1 Tax=Pseudotabrizicola sp. 4114 TaxID=2817731 RepID=UPI0032B77C21
MDTPGQILVRRTKRLWTDEEKRSICFQTTAPGVSVAQVARRYAVNANMVFKWLCDPRYEPSNEVSPANAYTSLPVEIIDHHQNTIMPPVSEPVPSAAQSGGISYRASSQCGLSDPHQGTDMTPSVWL